MNTDKRKGNVVRSMFRDIDADIYVMVDGDDTYPAEEVHKLIKPVQEGIADMAIGRQAYKWNISKKKIKDTSMNLETT